MRARRRALLGSALVLLLGCDPAPEDAPDPDVTSEAAAAVSPAPSASTAPSAPAASPTENPDSSPSPAAAAFLDDFEDPDSGWSTRMNQGEARYADGAYEILIGPGQADLSQAPETFPGNASVTVRVDAQRLRDHPGQFGAGWGVTCGEDFGGGRFYEGIVQVSRGVGYPGLWRWNGPDAGDVEVYRKADERHSAVRPDGINELELRCIQTAEAITVVFLINGIEVGRGVDSDPPDIDEWETGLYIDGSPMPKGHKARIRWDNYEVIVGPGAGGPSPEPSPEGEA